MIDFDKALLTFGKLLIDALGRQAACGGRILRDIYGRLSFVTPGMQTMMCCGCRLLRRLRLTDSRVLS